jgi:hypothetical protein
MAKRYHRGNQNSYIKEEQTTQWPKDTTGVIRIRKSKKNSMFFFDWRILVTFWYLLTIVLSVLLLYIRIDYAYGIFWPLCFFCSSLIDGFWLPHRGNRNPSIKWRTDKTMAKRYHKGNQNPYIKEEQTTQWPKDTTGVIRIRISKFYFGHCIVCP